MDISLKFVISHGLNFDKQRIFKGKIIMFAFLIKVLEK